MNPKGFVTLEYILLFASILSCLSVVVVGVITLYNRNIQAIDGSRFEEFCKDLKNNIELLEIMPEGKLELDAGNIKAWQMTKKNSKILEIASEKRNCEINTTITFNLQNKRIEKNQKIVLAKQNNTLNIN